MSHGRRIAATAAAGLLAGGVFLTVPAASADPDRKQNRGQDKTVSLNAQLRALNMSGASGTAFATVRNQKIKDISVMATGLSPTGAMAPHAMHIHYGDTARNECPTVARDDADRNGLLNTAEGVPAYGPIVTSLTTSGDTSPASGLAVDRFPTANASGAFTYSRSNIEFTDVAGAGPGGSAGTPKSIADAIRDGEGVVVIHGVDLNRNGAYDFASAGASELDPSLPQEATAPAACGVLNVSR